VTDELVKDQKKTKELYSLYAGSLPRSTVAAEGPLDVQRIQEICSFDPFTRDDPIFDALGVDIGRSEAPNLGGLWVLPGFANHSCVPSAHWNVYGDVMVIYAAVGLAPGDEITLDYGVQRSEPEPAKQLLDDHGFACDCPMCREERADPNLRQRAAIATRYNQERETILRLPRHAAIPKLRQFVEKLEATYTPGNRYRRLLRGPLDQLAQMLFKEGNLPEAISAMAKAAECDPGWLTGIVEYQQRLVEWYAKADNWAMASAYLTRVVKLVEAISGIKPKTYLALREPQLDHLTSGKFVREMISKMPS
jgi:hypothetical protein